MGNQKTASYEFGPFLLVLRERALWKGAEPISLTPKEFDTLWCLVREAGRLATKEQILGEVWPDTFVSDGSLSRNISVLRKVLGNGYIETVPKAGYRFTERVACSVSTVGHGPIPAIDPPASLAPESVVAFNAPQFGSQLGHKGPTSLNGLRRRRALNRGKTQFLWASWCLFLAVAVSACFVLARNTKDAPKSVSPRPVRLIVLPVENLAGAADQDYVADGLTEEMITRIGKTDPHSLGLIASATTMRFKKSAESPVQIGRDLHVDYVLVSNLNRQEKRVQISVQLVRVSDELLIWSAQYERDDGNVSGIPSQIALSIAKPLQVMPKANSAVQQSRETTDAEAYDDYLRGRFFWNKRLKEDVLIAKEYFSKAIVRDPNYAKAYAGLADCYIVLAGSHMPADVAFAEAQDFAQRAIFLDDTLADPHDSLAYVLYAQDWDWVNAEHEYKRASELDPQYALTHHWYSIYLTSMKRFPEAVAETTLALELDPLSQSINYNAGMTYMLANDDERALRQLQKAIELDPTNPVPYGYLGLLYEREHKYDQATEQFRKAEGFETEKSTYQFDIAGAYARKGKKSEARNLAEQLAAYSKTHYTNPYWFAAMYSGFGDANKVLPWLAMAVHQRSCTALEINTDTRLDFVRSDPRFETLASEMHLRSH